VLTIPKLGERLPAEARRTLVSDDLYFSNTSQRPQPVGAGASSGIRRTLSAATCGSLALLGAVIGTAGAYLGLAAGYVGDLGQLVPVPVIHLLTLVLGIPAVAALAGWLVSGRQPPSIGRQSLDG